MTGARWLRAVLPALEARFRAPAPAVAGLSGALPADPELDARIERIVRRVLTEGSEPQS